MFNIKKRIKRYIDLIINESLPKPIDTKGKVEYPALNILLEQQGYARTVETRLPVAADGSAIPWYTYPAIEYFNQLNAKELRVFEYGSGNSSLYWAHKGAYVWSVEHDPLWHETMRTKSAQLQSLYLRESATDYAGAINLVKEDFDLIVIDGAWRNECASAAITRLREGGIIILDNSDWYTDVASFLQKSGFFQIDFNGYGPINNYCWTTSIFLSFSSSITNRIGHPRPIGGIEVFKVDKW